MWYNIIYIVKLDDFNIMIDILMAVYNGGEFLAPQINSIISQDMGDISEDWRLVICDDGSSDGSFEAAGEYERRFPGRIRVTRNETPTGSAKGNFMGMLRESTGEYVMFSDQDDVWKSEKLRVTLAKMRELERQFPGKPLLVHTDMAVADRELNVTAPSFVRFQGLRPRCKSLARLLCQNNITGCTVMINRALADIIKDAPPEGMLMHDWWAGLAAAAFGEIGFVDVQTSLYRQHGGNSLGAVRNQSISGIAKIIAGGKSTKKRLDATYIQAQHFCDAYRDLLAPNDLRILEIYSGLIGRNKAAKIYGLIKYGFLKQNFMAAVGQLIFC